MAIRLLYPLLALCVLLLGGCGTADSPSTAQEQASEPSSEVAAAPSPSDPTPDAPDTARTDTPTILFLGNSLAAGYGLPQEQAFPALIQDRIDSLGWDFRVVNAGLSGETTSGGLRRAPWLLRQRVDVLVLELGGNDGLRGIPLDVTRSNLQGIIDTTRALYPDARVVLAGMQIPPNLGQDYTERFRVLFPELAEANDTALIPFLLKDVGGIPELNLPDGIHPTAEGHEIVAENVWETLRPILEDMRQQG